MAQKKKANPRKEFLIFALIAVAGVGIWFLLAYHPIMAKTNKAAAEAHNDQDSVAAIQRYQTQESALRAQAEQLKADIATWDSRFPPRDSIVAIAKLLISFAQEKGLDLIDIQPSLFELYALERAGAQVSGSYVMQLPISFQLQGRYLDLGQMLEEMDKLPFNITVADLALADMPEQVPVVNIHLEVYLYVHI
jgi:Tfp pilus assembly protein PilO